MRISKQEQRAGDASNQIQANNIIVQTGMTSKEAGDIFRAIIPSVLSEYKKEAFNIAEERVNRLENKLLPMIESIEGALENFKDPAFQMQLRNAQMSAAVCNQESDLDMLSQLMIKHIEIKENREKRLGVKKAIEIIGYIDNKALLSLTILCIFLNIIPTNNNVYDGLENLEKIYNKLLYDELPKDDSWIDHLELLNVISTYRYSNKFTLQDLCLTAYEGYASAGIEKGSENYKKATNLLLSIRMDSTSLIDNPLLEGYVILPIVNKNIIKNLEIDEKTEGGIKKRVVTEREAEILLKIFDLYDKEMKEKAIQNFISLWDTHPTLKKIHEWTDQIPFRINLNIVGLTLAATNAKRCVPSIGNLDFWGR